MSSIEQDVPLVIPNIHAAFLVLGEQVNRSLQTQIGDAARLNEQKRQCLRFLSQINQHLHTLSNHDQETILSSVALMIDSLDGAITTSSDVPDAPPVVLGAREIRTSAGRPRVGISYEDLTLLVSGRRVTHAELAALYNCNPRTIRRRLLEFGLSQPGPPVYTSQMNEDGNVTRIYRPGSSSDLSNLSDDQLDTLVLSIYHQFPSFGRRMMDGYLLQLGHRVPRSRLEASCLRVIGPPTATFASRRIQRRVYNVAGPMALIHHDGQHGLIRWRIVIHGFIDGFSRFVLGMRASNNNRAETVLELFEDIAAVHGYPSRVRGDHGTENLLVAARMEEVRGLERGSYIWGRSVHNIRIERLWVDVTSGLGLKWKDFFQALEAHDGLDINNQAHLWLLHEIFVPMINQEADIWAATWNCHVIARQGERHLSPHAMFLHGVLDHGQRSVYPAHDDDIANIDEYGIDWDDLENHRIRSHHNDNNLHDIEEAGYQPNPFVLSQPDQLSHVNVPNTSCPFATQAQHDEFQRCLHPLIDHTSLYMDSRRLLWIEALELAVRVGAE